MIPSFENICPKVFSTDKNGFIDQCLHRWFPTLKIYGRKIVGLELGQVSLRIMIEGARQGQSSGGNPNPQRIKNVCKLHYSKAPPQF